MVKSKDTYDVFVSYSQADKDLAREIAVQCKENRLQAFVAGDMPQGESLGDRLWDALSESRAFVIILSDVGPTPHMGVELGAAQAWHKPVFGVVRDPRTKIPSSSMPGIHLYPAERIDDIIRAVKESGDDFTEPDYVTLAEIYRAINVSVDQLALAPRELEKLARKFNDSTGKLATGERLLSELLRMRKMGKLKSTGRTEIETRDRLSGKNVH